jgi:uncharacterized repeat protein (TIGR01451 family)
MKIKRLFNVKILVLAVVAYAAVGLVISNFSTAGPFGSMPAWCTPGVPNASSTHCAGNTVTLTDGGGNFQSRWMGQYAVQTSGGSQWWMTYCLRDDQSHPNVTSDGTIVPTLIDINGAPVTLNPKYSYVTWKWGDTSDNNEASAVWMLGHYYAQDVTGSGNVIVPNLNASNNATINALAQAMDTEAGFFVGSWTVNFNLNVPPAWTGSSTSGTLTLLSGAGVPLQNTVVNLSATGGSVSPSSVTTNASGQATFTYSSTGGVVTVNGSVSGPGNYLVVDPPGGADQLVGTSGGSQNFTGSANATPDPRYAVGDYVWYDVDRDGIQDASELPVNNVTVELLDSNGAVVGTTTTDSNGHYVFDNLTPGTYSIRFSDLPNDYLITSQQVATGTSSNDSNPNNSGQTPTFTINGTAPDMRVPVASDGTTVAVMINPTIDMGIYQKQIDLAVAKSLVTPGPFKTGQKLVYKLTARNNGPDNAVAGWSVTDLLPTNLTFEPTVIASGTDPSFTCTNPVTVSGGTSLKCTSNAPLNNGQEMFLYLNVSIDQNAPQSTSFRNLTFVSPSVNETVETIPLVTPTFSTGNTNQTTTNNDSEAVLSLAAEVIPTVPNTGQSTTQHMMEQTQQAAKKYVPIMLIIGVALPMSALLMRRNR